MKPSAVIAALCLLLTSNSLLFAAFKAGKFYAPELGQAVDVVADEALVKLKEGIPASQLTENGYVVKSALHHSRWHVVRFPGKTLESALSHLKSLDFVEMAEPDTLYKIFQTNDPAIGLQQHLPKIVWDTAWLSSAALSLGPLARMTTVAIIDTGVDLEHPDLKPLLWRNADEIADNGVDDDGNGFVDDVNGNNFLFDPSGDSTPSSPTDTQEAEYERDRRPLDTNGHGTQVAGYALAMVSNSTFTAGVSWKSVCMVLKVADETGAKIKVSRIADAIRYAADNGAQVINISIGGPFKANATRDAVEEAFAKGVVIVAAAGNESESSISFPAALPQVIAVGATDNNDVKAFFSNSGIDIDVAAPGVDVTSTFGVWASTLSTGLLFQSVASSTRTGSGTSFSSPLVAGLAALLLSKEPLLTPTEVRKRIQGSADDVDLPGWDIRTGFGRINVFRTLSQNLVSSEPEGKPISIPNPFFPSQRDFVTIQLPKDQVGKKFNVRIFTLSGDLVRILSEGTQDVSSDSGKALWNGRDDRGEAVASGAYFYSVEVGGKRLRGKLTLIK